MPAFVKRNDGRYQRTEGRIQYPVTEDEALYAFHLCFWLSVPNPTRRLQQVSSRRIQDGRPQYCMYWDSSWYDESVVELSGLQKNLLELV